MLSRIGHIISLLLISQLTLVAQVEIPATPKKPESKYPKTEVLTQNPAFKINLLGVGAGAEVALSKSSTLNFEAGTSFFVRADNSDLELVYFPYASLDYRLYYNMEKRVFRGKKTWAFSGNYTTIRVTRRFRNEYFDGFWCFSPSWGFQRRIVANLYYNLNLGPAYFAFADASNFIGLNVNFSMGFVLQKPRALMKK